MQRPLMQLLHGGASTEILAWEADLEVAVAHAIEQHLAVSPCPGQSQVARDLGQWAAGLRLDAQSRLGLAEPRRRLA